MGQLRWKIAQAAEIRWWKNYLKTKPVADYVAWKTDYWNDFLRTIGYAPLAKQRVLDAGCGPAGVFMALGGHQVDALDPLLDAYARDLPHFSPKDYPWARFISQPIENFVQEQAYDTVFCLNAINHVAQLDDCMDTLVSATRRGGQLVVSIDAHNHPFFKRVFRVLPGDILHPHQYDLAEYEAMLTRRGCTIEQRHLLKKAFFFNYFVLVARRQ